MEGLKTNKKNEFCYYGNMKLLILFAIFARSEAYSVSDANNLHTALFTNYKKLVLPEFPVLVQAEYNLLTVNALEIKSQTLTTSGWFTVVWNDTRLTWTKATYGDIEHIYVTQNSIWHPELIVENSVTDLTNLGDDNIQLRVRYDGEVRWEPPAILATSCDMDVTHFPYDTQTCDIELASWGFHTDAVNLTFYNTKINLLDYRTNGEWDLITTTQLTSEIVDEDNMAYAELLFRIVLTRLPGHYIMSVIIPVIITAVLTSVTFILPVESGEKVGYILTVLLALAVLLTLFADNMPTTSKNTSVLVIFLTVTLGLASCSIILTVLIIKLYHKPTEETLPDWIHKMAWKCETFSCKRKYNENNPTQKKEDVEDKKGAWAGEEKDHKPETFKKYTNKELAKFFDSLCFVVFTVLYFVVCLCFTIVLAVSG